MSMLMSKYTSPEHQEEFRKKLFEHMKMQAFTINEASAIASMDKRTLLAFLQGKDLRYNVLVRIERILNAKKNPDAKPRRRKKTD